MRAGHDRPATRHPGTLSFHWGDAHLLTCTRDRWVALRRDRHRFLTAHTLTGLKTAIEADYRDHPVPPDSGPPGADGYLNFPEHDPTPDAGTPAGRQPPPAPAPASPANGAPAAHPECRATVCLGGCCPVDLLPDLRAAGRAGGGQEAFSGTGWTASGQASGGSRCLVGPVQGPYGWAGLWGWLCGRCGDCLWVAVIGRRAA